MESMLVKGMELAIYGMGSVFLFLTVLVMATSLMSRLILAFEPEEVPQRGPKITGQLTEPRLIAVITATVKQFRSDHEHS
ncbi:MAG: OadG family transporter subunit [Gammaproteobacteria bacterium]|nr:OadG family transporter subunit [Gammaproteobacteria bacterium]